MFLEGHKEAFEAHTSPLFLPDAKIPKVEEPCAPRFQQALGPPKSVVRSDWQGKRVQSVVQSSTQCSPVQSSTQCSPVQSSTFLPRSQPATALLVYMYTLSSAVLTSSAKLNTLHLIL